ncbi:isoprenylcysteine carboxylmethyltransferase family protein [bacterium]|nr:isoprenylcysteine carboxylmethyltransferase family protein [bacterium]RQV94414.1 MAG: isoprenylcysteine carboxylmethyltransferase family protein [bacterium]
MDLRHLFFKYRSYTPIGFILLLLICADPTWPRFFCGLAVLLLGETIRFWGVAYAGSATRTTGAAGGDRLVTDGPYGHMRNPLYVGNFFISLGFLIMTWVWIPWMIVVFMVLFGLQYSLIVHLEEEYLSDRFKESYREYRQSVPRWIPRLKLYKGSEESDPRFVNTLKSERNTLQAIAAVCGLLLVRWHFL